MRTSYIALAFAALAASVCAAPIGRSASNALAERCDDCSPSSSGASATVTVDVNVKIDAAVKVVASITAHAAAEAHAALLADIEVALKVRAELTALVKVTVGEARTKCSDAIVQIDVAVSSCESTFLKLVARLDAEVKAGATTSIAATISLLLKLSALLQTCISVGITGCSSIFVSIQAAISVCLKAYLAYCRDTCANGSAASLKICLSILRSCTSLFSSVGLAAQLNAVISLCVTALLRLGVVVSL